MTIDTSGLFARRVGQFPVCCHVPSRASGITHVRALTPLNALTLLRVGVFVQRPKPMAFIETLFENACALIKVTSPSTRLHLVPELCPEVFANIP